MKSAREDTFLKSDLPGEGQEEPAAGLKGRSRGKDREQKAAGLPGKERFMFDRFGEFDSAEEINATAAGLRKEGDRESLEVLAKENGIDGDLVEAFWEGDLLYLCDDMSAAIGKLDVEAQEIKCAEILGDWVEYLKAQCLERPEVAAAVRRKGKSLAGCVAALLHWSFRHQTPVDEKILKAANVKAGRCTLGIPGMATAKKLMTEYYLGKGGAGK
ncbi:MAG: hypothetical protein NC432_08685 [Roseburia sp.]|nr:hypothetical protein [Roseburia sp.]MCM1097811.1 hypothetical protein [Ruminococcus flavefaciens]